MAFGQYQVSQNLKNMAEQKRQRQIEESKAAEVQRKFQLEQEKLSVQRERDQRDFQLKLEEGRAMRERENALSDAKVRNLDKDSQSKEADTLRKIEQDRLYPGGPEYYSVDQKIQQGMIKEKTNRDSSQESLESTQQKIDPEMLKATEAQAQQQGKPQLTVGETSGPSLPVDTSPTGEASQLPKAPVVGAYPEELVKFHQEMYPEIVKRNLSDQNKLYSLFKDELDENVKQVRDISESMNVAAEKTRQSWTGLMQRTKELNDNPPLRSQALSNVGWTGKIASFAHALLQGYLKGAGQVPPDAPLLLDEIIEREYNDLMVQFQSEKSTLSFEGNLIKLNYELEKDELNAQLATRYQLMDIAQNVFSSELKKMQFSGAQEQQAALVQAHFLEKKRGYEDSLKQNYFDNNLQLKTIEAKTKSSGFDYSDVIKMNKEGRDQVKFERSEQAQRIRVNISTPKGAEQIDLNYGNAQKQAAAQKAIATTRSSISQISDLRSVTKLLKGFGGLKKAAQQKLSFLGIKATNKAQAQFDTLKKGLTKTMLGERIDFTGGGNMAVVELQFLQGFFEAHQNDGSLRIWMKERRGKYNNLFNIMEKLTFRNSVNKMLESEKFKTLPREKKLKAAAKLAGISPSKALELAGKWDLNPY